jgi:hypothetical protein
MRTLAFCLLLSLAGCAALEPNPNPMTADDVIALSKSGAPAKEIIDQLFRTRSVIPVTAADIVRLHEAGVSSEVLDFMQYAQLQEIRWRDQFYYWNGPGFYRGFGPCPFPPPRFHRGGSWGC